MPKSRKVKVAVIGCGGRSKGVVKNLLNDSKRNVEILAVYDPDEAVAEGALRAWDSKAKNCKTYAAAIKTPGVEWVMVFSPNAYHCEHILAAFKAKKHVFSEKPLATDIGDCQKIFDAHRKSGMIFATGFVLRYSKLYEKVKELLDSGKFGDLLSINADENIAPEHGGYIMRNWRRFTKFSGPHILEKCCHDLDLINWFCGSLPSRVASFGNRRFFVPENESFMKQYGEKTFCSWDDPHGEPSPFTSEKDLMDNQCSIAQYRNGVNVTFQCTMSNAIPERRMYFTCSRGNIIAELYKSTIEYKLLGDACNYRFDFGADGHGGGDGYIMKELYKTMTTGTMPKCSGNEGLESAVFAMALDQAATTGKVVDLEPVWKKLHR